MWGGGACDELTERLLALSAALCSGYGAQYVKTTKHKQGQMQGGLNTAGLEVHLTRQGSVVWLSPEAKGANKALAIHPHAPPCSMVLILPVSLSCSLLGLLCVLLVLQCVCCIMCRPLSRSR